MTVLALASPVTLLVPGLLCAVTVALAATFLSEHYGIPVMLMALLLGMALNFLSEPGSRCLPGIEFASKKLLRFGVALLGLGITVQQVMASGPEVLAIAVSGVALTIGSGLLLARLLGLPMQMGILAGGAVGICGASAALAISSVLPRREGTERATVFTVIGVTALSTVAMILYPILTERLGLGDVATGVFFGATIHDVAQVVGAGYSVSQEAGDTAVFVKLLRVALLIPIVTGLSLVMGTGRGGESGALPIPLFVLGFAALVVLGSAGLVPEEVKVALLSFSRWCLVVAIAALGTKTSLGRLAAVGGRPILLICTLTLLLALYALGLIGLLF
ncbi:putative sulfate exporter family transporter [Rhodobacter sphaeroides]|uniref:YeiH family protein n=1 Tax=Cereibacter sphaeroides TaxID=1063 RepID=UPI0013274DE9|nr:putative sulfate exporter family transporter [Cereibacter sphaeroides]MWP37030.1 putative sulfate exporter family transporter [Cereibacter sphaeroides]